MLTFSLSALQAWQRCQQRYQYAYVAKLRQKMKDVAPKRGNMLHEYLAAYYLAIRNGSAPLLAHQAGQKTLMARRDELKSQAAVSFYAGEEEEAQEYLNILPDTLDISGRYFRVRGETDAKRYQVLRVEEKFDFQLAAGITSTSIIDLVLRDRTTNLVWLVEHKSTRSVPDSAVRLRDLQTLLYAEVLSRHGLHVDGVLWNYLRTKVPDVPHQNKDGRFSKAVAIDTTWEVYQKAVIDAGQDPETYEDVRQRLSGREKTAFFPRHEHVIVADSNILLGDYAAEAVAVRTARRSWEMGITRPTRTIARDCSFCPYWRICEAALMGGDEEDVIALRFTTEREEEPALQEEVTIVDDPD